MDSSLVVSSSNHEQNGSSFDRLRTSVTAHQTHHTSTPNSVSPIRASASSQAGTGSPACQKSNCTLIFANRAVTIVVGTRHWLMAVPE